MMNKEMIMELDNWVVKRNMEDSMKYNAIAKKSKTNFAALKMEDDDFVLYYKNSMPEENVFAGFIDFTNIRDIETANLLVNSEEDFNRLYYILTSKEYRNWKLGGLQKFRSEKIDKINIGKDITAEQIQKLITDKSYDELHEVLCKLFQEKLNYQEIAWLIASEVDINYIFENRKKDPYTILFSSYLSIHDINDKEEIDYYRVLSANCGEYSKFEQHQERSRASKRAWITRRANKQQEVQA